MIVLTMASAMYLAGLQASITGPRMAFVHCLKQASEKAEVEKVEPQAFEAILRSACTPQGERLKTALVAFDVKNGVSRTRATTDAEADVADGFASSTETYKWRMRSDSKEAAAN